jgi:hypothetical protein
MALLWPARNPPRHGLPEAEERVVEKWNGHLRRAPGASRLAVDATATTCMQGPPGTKGPPQPLWDTGCWGKALAANRIAKPTAPLPECSAGFTKRGREEQVAGRRALDATRFAAGAPPAQPSPALIRPFSSFVLLRASLNLPEQFAKPALALPSLPIAHRQRQEEAKGRHESPLPRPPSATATPLAARARAILIRATGRTCTHQTVKEAHHAQGLH